MLQQCEEVIFLNIFCGNEDQSNCCNTVLQQCKQW